MVVANLAGCHHKNITLQLAIEEVYEGAALLIALDRLLQREITLRRDLSDHLSGIFRSRSDHLAQQFLSDSVQRWP